MNNIVDSDFHFNFLHLFFVVLQQYSNLHAFIGLALQAKRMKVLNIKIDFLCLDYHLKV